MRVYSEGYRVCGPQFGREPLTQEPPRESEQQSLCRKVLPPKSIGDRSWDNLKDFPDDALGAYGIEEIHPDSFIFSQLDLAPSVELTAVKQTRARLKNPPRSPEEYLGCLGEQGLTQTVSELRRSIQLI